MINDVLMTKKEFFIYFEKYKNGTRFENWLNLKRWGNRKGNKISFSITHMLKFCRLQGAECYRHHGFLKPFLYMLKKALFI